MKKFFKKASLLFLAVSSLLTAGCYRELEDRVEVLDQDVRLVEGEIDAISATIESLSTLYITISQFDELKGVADQLKSDIGALSDAVKANTGSIKDNSDFQEILRDRINALDNDIKDIKETIAHLDGNVTLNAEGINSLTQFLDKKTKELDDKINALDTYVQKVGDLKGNVETLDESLKGLAEDLKNMGGNVQALEEKYETLSSYYSSLLTQIEALSGGSGQLDLRLAGIEGSIELVSNDIAAIAKDIHFITMAVVPETLVNGVPALVINCYEDEEVTFSVTLEVSPAARVKELVDHIAFDFIPVKSITRSAAEAVTVSGTEYKTDTYGRIEVTGVLPETNPFVDEIDNAWKTSQSFAVAVKYVDDSKVAQLSTDYMPAYLYVEKKPEPKNIAVILGGENYFWSGVARGINASVAASDDYFTVKTFFCDDDIDQLEAIGGLSEISNLCGVVIGPKNSAVEDALATFLSGSEIPVPAVTVGPVLAEDSSLKDLVTNQISTKDTLSVETLCATMTDIADEDILILTTEASTTLANKAVSCFGGKARTLQVTTENAVTKIETILEFNTNLKAAIILDDSLITGDVLAATKDLDVYAFGRTEALIDAVKNGSVKTGALRYGYDFGKMAFATLFGTYPSPRYIDAHIFTAEDADKYILY